jgi:hypothetical protein
MSNLIGKNSQVPEEQPHKKLYFDLRADDPTSPNVNDYWTTVKELLRRLPNLLGAKENIDQVSKFSHFFSPKQLTNAVVFRTFVTLRTRNWWWSIEKNDDGITFQRSKNLEGVRDRYRRDNRYVSSSSSTTPIQLIETAKGNMSVNELVNYLIKESYFYQEYNIINHNCQHFADTIFGRLKAPKYKFEHVYFDPAADELPDAKTAWILPVDKFISQVRELSASETLVEIEVYKAPISTNSKWKPTDAWTCWHLFLIFRTNLFNYWSIERWPTHFTVQRAKSKNVLVNKCQRMERPDNWFSSVKRHRSADISKKVTMSDVLDYIWNNNQMDLMMCNPQETDKSDVLIVRNIYNRFKDGGRTF